MKKFLGIILVSLLLCTAAVADVGHNTGGENPGLVNNFGFYGFKGYTPTTLAATALSTGPTVYAFTTSGGTSTTTLSSVTTGNYTLATSNVVDGAIKLLYAKDLVSSKCIVVTPAATSGYDAITLANNGDSCLIIKRDGKWVKLTEMPTSLSATIGVLTVTSMTDGTATYTGGDITGLDDITMDDLTADVVSANGSLKTPTITGVQNATIVTATITNLGKALNGGGYAISNVSALTATTVNPSILKMSVPTAAATATAVSTYNVTFEIYDTNGVVYLIPAVAK